MRKSVVILFSGAMVLLVIFAVPPVSAQSRYAEDRALIEDLQARYMFALDFQDADAYASTFTRDGVLEFSSGEKLQGREAFRNYIIENRKMVAGRLAKENPELTPIAGGHHLTNIVIKVDGNKAIGRAYWFTINNGNPERTANLRNFGHYEDEMIKVGGKWLFSSRKIRRLQASRSNNPAHRILKKLHNDARTTHVPAPNFAVIYVGLGKTNEALNRLEKALDEGTFLTANYYPQIADFEPLRSHPRYKALFRKMNMEP